MVSAAAPAVCAGLGSALLLLALLRPAPPGLRAAPNAGHAAPVVRWATARVARAGIPFPAAAVLGAVGAATVAAAGLAFAAGSLVVAAGALLAVPAAAHAAVSARERRYPDRIAAQLPGALRAVADGIAAGRSLRQALARSAEAAPEPIAAELGILVGQLELGGRVDTALADLSRRCPAPEIELMRGAILVNAGSGGDLARVLGDLGNRLDERRRLSRELRGLGEQARMTAWLVGALPAFGGLVVELTAPGVLARALLNGVGRVSLVVSAALLVAAMLLIRRMGRR